MRPSRGLVLFLLLNLVIIGSLVYSVFTLITLLFEDCSADAIPAIDIPPPDAVDAINKLPQYIPKIIHQTWVNESIPEKWQKAQQSCRDLHGDYEYMVGLLVQACGRWWWWWLIARNSSGRMRKPGTSSRRSTAGS